MKQKRELLKLPVLLVSSVLFLSSLIMIMILLLSVFSASLVLVQGAEPTSGDGAGGLATPADEINQYQEYHNEEDPIQKNINEGNWKGAPEELFKQMTKEDIKNHLSLAKNQGHRRQWIS